jgi:hypothetical protein
LLRGAAYYGARRYREAVAEFTKIVEPLNEVHGWLAASYAQLGSLDQAKARLELFLRGAEVDMAIFPGRRLKDLKSYWRGAMFYRDERDYDHLFDGLRKAGLPE